jgi:hypothetical protein
VLHVAGAMTGAPRVESLPGTVDLVVCDLELVCGSTISAVLDNDDLHPGGPTPIVAGEPLILALANSRVRHRPLSPWTIWAVD